MTKKLVAHLGFHKTGTTALQESFSTHRDLLKDHGIIYPDLGQKAHHRAAWALIGRSWGWKNKGGKNFPIAEWEKLVKKTKKNNQTTLISSEFFCELSAEQIERFKKDINCKDVAIVFTLRPLLKLLTSSYQQYLKYGLTPTYEEWLHSVLDQPGKSKLTPTFWKRHEHGRVIRQWAEVFGPENVYVVIADERQPTAIFEAFNSILGLPAATITQVEGISSNRSLTYEEVCLLLEINKYFPKDRVWTEYEIYIREGAIKHLTDNVRVDQSAEKLLTPQWAVDKVKEISAASVARIKESGVNIIGNIDNFEGAEIPIGENSNLTHVSLFTAAQALIANDNKSLRRQSSRVIFNEALWRIKRIIKSKL
jgi:hypothetical protein